MSIIITVLIKPRLMYNKKNMLCQNYNTTSLIFLDIKECQNKKF